jgi:8-oxo-dGTP pyrophosphatase MutT (NUDIX family)
MVTTFRTQADTRPDRAETTDRAESILAVHMIFRRDNAVLMSRRRNTGWHDGDLSLVAGHVQPDESVLDAALRESREEVGATLDPSELVFVGVMHRRSDAENRTDFFFRVTGGLEDVHNAEPDKCAELIWLDETGIDRDDVVPYIRQALRETASRVGWFALSGW